MGNTKSYGQYCPIAITAEIICQRWTVLVLRAFFLGATRFSEIQKSAPLMSSALLTQRLRELETAGIIRKQKMSGSNSYQLTPSGEALFPILDQMGSWSQTWLRREITNEENLDPDVLMWELRRANLDCEDISRRRRVAHFMLTGTTPTKRNYWLVFEPEDTDICTKDPGHEVDIWISAHIKTLVEIWLGHRTIAKAVDDDLLILEGNQSEINHFHNWFSLSHFASKA
ncbi:winged helix-turn-helix transcriptional regulator [Sneathiella limimaris]|uniref:winged helix-turn-helix transcriptional regulator n=1 Tax=Sneathiella limimaris TaxID=1964213 RepID=UPI00146DE046|nr:helix-turn-helix domain-containing protein [Sneathiella limimaris]